ncbi:MAG TPA: hypothetical protein VKU01_34590 [Bryobacteraceae bacterium]|nr:hypothetical protein [Bryobacteraceae bacterium]
MNLLPIVSWIKQDSELDVSYDDALEEIISKTTRIAKIYQVKYAPPEKSGLAPRHLVQVAMFCLQRKIFDQYLPPIEPKRIRSIGYLWPIWGRNEITVALDSGKLHAITPLPPENGVLQEREIDGVPYKFKLYSNNTEQQRLAWLHRELEDEARRERGAGPSKRDDQLDEAQQFVDTGSDFGAIDQLFKEWLSITSSGDWQTIENTSRSDTAKERKERSRAAARLMAGYNILCNPLPSGRSKRCLDRLKTAEDADRKGILDEYLRFNPEHGRRTDQRKGTGQ